MAEQQFHLADEYREKTVRTILMGAFVLAAVASAAPAMAQDSATFTVQTTVPAFCSQFSVGQAPMDLGALTGATGQLVGTFASGSQTERQLATNFYCNAPSTITIKAEPLMHETVTVVTDSASFTNRVDYTATLKWNGLESAVSSTAPPMLSPAAKIFTPGKRAWAAMAKSSRSLRITSPPAHRPGLSLRPNPR